jgi:hypothetical protein
MVDVLQFLLDLILQPGSSLKLVPVINIAIICLIFILSALLFYQSLASVHVLVMGGLAVGLLLSVNWYDDIHPSEVLVCTVTF